MTTTTAIYLILSSHQLVFTLTWALTAWWRVSRRVTTVWTLAGAVATLGLLCIALNGHAPDWVGMVAGRSLLLGCMLLQRHGVLHFARRYPAARWMLLAWAAGTAVLLALHLLGKPQALIVCYAVFQALVLLDIGRLILHHLSAEFGSLLVRITAAPFLGMALLYAHRAWQHVDYNDGLMQLELPSQATAIGLSMAALMLNLSLLTLIGARLVMQLRHRSDHDGLTGLLNRRSAEERLAEELARARRHGTSLALLSIDVDHFKRINDTLGHPVGDQVLIRMAALLRGAVRQGDSVARVGGEEFWVLAPNTHAAGAEQLAQRVLAAAREPLLLPGDSTISLTVSVGAALSAPEQEPVSALLKRLDAALYAAKDGGRNRLAWAVPALAHPAETTP